MVHFPKSSRLEFCWKTRSNDPCVLEVFWFLRQSHWTQATLTVDRRYLNYRLLNILFKKIRGLNFEELFNFCSNLGCLSQLSFSIQNNWQAQFLANGRRCFGEHFLRILEKSKPVLISEKISIRSVGVFIVGSLLNASNFCRLLRTFFANKTQKLHSNLAASFEDTPKVSWNCRNWDYTTFKSSSCWSQRL